MPTKSLLITFMLCISGIVFSQTELYTIQLKNGNTVKGTLVEKIPGETITIKTAENEELKLAYDEIQKITTTEAPKENETIKSDSIPPYPYKKRGFINHTEASFILGVGSVSGVGQKNEDRGFGIRTVNGFQFSETMALGIGIGLEKYIDAVLVPVTLDARATLMKGKTSPTININVGYAPNIEGFNEGGGFVINPSFGVKTYVSRKTAFFFNVGYKIQQDKFSYYAGGNFYNKQTTNVTFKFINFSLGLAF
ncbi:MAG: hypothetical protein V4604_05550 [Bacteroidota bacterium]